MSSKDLASKSKRNIEAAASEVAILHSLLKDAKAFTKTYQRFQQNDIRRGLPAATYSALLLEAATTKNEVQFALSQIAQRGSEHYKRRLLRMILVNNCSLLNADSQAGTLDRHTHLAVRARIYQMIWGDQL
jgi:hypothetical protein